MANKMAIMPNRWNKSTKIVFNDNYFGDNQGIYNLMELNCSLANGSSISGNTFSAGCCSHNIINVYQVDDGATIDINNNVFAYSANAIRIGCKGAPTDVTINITGNRYDSTDTSDNGAWGGLVMIQPYGNATTDMSGITINITGTVNNTSVPQIVYYFAWPTDAQLIASGKLPVVKLNGVVLSPEEFVEASTLERELPEPVEPESDPSSGQSTAEGSVEPMIDEGDVDDEI